MVLQGRSEATFTNLAPASLGGRGFSIQYHCRCHWRASGRTNEERTNEQTNERTHARSPVLTNERRNGRADNLNGQSKARIIIDETILAWLHWTWAEAEAEAGLVNSCAASLCMHFQCVKLAVDSVQAHCHIQNCRAGRERAPSRPPKLRSCIENGS